MKIQSISNRTIPPVCKTKVEPHIESRMVVHLAVQPVLGKVDLIKSYVGPSGADIPVQGLESGCSGIW